MSPAALGGAAEGFDLALEEESSWIYGADPDRRAWSWTLPGSGAPCGRNPDKLPLRHRLCPGAHVVPYIDTCDRRDCPVCWRKGWLRREARAVARDLLAESQARRERGQLSTVIHVSLSPPPSKWSAVDPEQVGPRQALRNYGPLRTRAYVVARKAGINGGRLFFHHARCKERRRRRETLIKGPHFHALGFGFVPPDAFERTGWVVTNHGARWSRRQVAGTARYILDHSSRADLNPGISAEGKSGGLTLTVTAFGRLVKATDTRPEGRFCPVCHVSYPPIEWIDLEWAGEGDPPTEPCDLEPSKWRAYRLLSWSPDRPADRREWVDLTEFVPAVRPEPADVAWLDRLLDENERKHRRSVGLEEVETRDPSIRDERAWAPLVPPGDAARALRAELDALDSEAADLRARRERWLRGGP